MANAKEPVEIETARFFLRPLHPMKLARQTHRWTKEKNAFEYFGWQTEGISLWRWYRHLRAHSRKSRHCRAILAKLSGRCIGFQIMTLNSDSKSGATGIFVGDKSWRGKRVQLEVTGAVVDHYFKTSQVDRVTATVNKRNAVSVKNALALGFVLEATMRDAVVLADGMRSDMLILGMLRSDWEERVSGADRSVA